MIKKLKILTYLCVIMNLTALSAKAIKPIMDNNISKVITFDTWKDTEIVKQVSPYYRYRAIIFNPIQSESGGRLVIEKIYKGGEDAIYETQIREEVSLIANKQMKKELNKMNGEQAMFCCHANKAKWMGYKLTYEVQIKSTFLCTINNVNKSQKPICIKSK